MEMDNIQKLEDEITGLLETIRKAPPYLIDNLTDKATVVLLNIETEYGTAPPDKKVGLQTRIRHYRHEIERARSSVESGGLGRTLLVAQETEQIGGEVGQELRGQREQLIRTRDRLEGTNDELSRIGRLITIIQMRVISNKILLIFLIIIECIIFVVLCYIKFILH